MTEIETIASANVCVGGVSTLSQSDVQAAVLAALNGLKSRIDAKPSPTAYVTQTWKSGSSWYRRYSDGWIEQGGRINVQSSVGSFNAYPVTLHLSHANATYFAEISSIYPNSSSNGWEYVHTQTKSSFKAVTCADAGGYFYWHTCGY